VLAKLFDHIDDLQIRFAAVRQRRSHIHAVTLLKEKSGPAPPN
jgi:hypothetical protein